MSETKTELAERAIKFSKYIIYCFIEDHGETFIPKLHQFVSTVNCHKKSIIWKTSQRCEEQ